MLDQIKIFLQYCYPKHLVSRLVGKLAAAELGSVTHTLIKLFVKRYQVNMDEALDSDIESYASFNDFFTRPLKQGLRPLVEGSSTLAHPVDGTVSQAGSIKYGRIIQAKGQDFSAKELLGGDRKLSEEFKDGEFATIYLAPSDYHRIHMPCKAKLRSMIFVPGDLFSVNPLTAKHVPELFARNERVVAIFDTAFGPMAMVLVGATIVASIETSWAGTIAPAGSRQITTWDYQNQGIELNKGDEMGRFKLGSTVVMLFAKEAIEWQEQVVAEQVTRMGEHMATIKPPQAKP